MTLTLKQMRQAVKENPQRYEVRDMKFILDSPVYVEFRYHALVDKKADRGVAFTRWRMVR